MTKASAPRFLTDILLFSFGVIFTALLIYISITYPSVIQENFDFYKVVLAISCAGIAAIIPGFFNLQYKGIIRAGGALGVFTFLILVMKPNEKAFSVRVVVEAVNGKRIEPNGKILMNLGSEPRQEPLYENNDAIFENIPITYLNKKVSFGINLSENYSLINPDSLYTLSDKEIIKLKIRLNLNNVIQGMVLYNDMPESGVVVRVGNLTDTTDANGFYNIILPTHNMQDEQVVTFYKPGFKLSRKTVFLQALKDLDMVLEK